MGVRSKSFALRVRGRNACFTRPEMKAERVSYDVMTPSAARGILDAILWKPALRWVVEEIAILAPIRWESVRRNEVGSAIPVRPVKMAMARGRGSLGQFVEDDRQQRAGMILRDVDYLVRAHFVLTDRVGPEDSMMKFEQMFLRRAARGQCFHRPYLGCREFPADFMFAEEGDGTPGAVDLDADLGFMLYDLDYDSSPTSPRFFRAVVRAGVLRVPAPDSEEVRS